MHDLFGVAGGLEALRNRFGTLHGLSGPRHGMMMAILHMEGERGVSVNGLAEHLHVRANFVTTETNKLRELGLIEKRDNPDDRRGVLVRLTPRGRALLERVMPELCELNDAIFQSVSAKDFDTLRRVLAALVGSLDDAHAVMERMEQTTGKVRTG